MNIEKDTNKELIINECKKYLRTNIISSDLELFIKPIKDLDSSISNYEAIEIILDTIERYYQDKE